ncbi:predicted protein [Histoplasma capsulatum var. duboisii H88]|uniref:Predicted protein n=2 Tax=Ajellomyces capsulatus TaxID=5037 RepID=F0UAZ7_AJEC8|nr:predicted protein [Histoplasma capsulatum H143]EGC42960.1 predicted protein [Histoplasma capsulatum var. duboisii H88]QSS49147.1 hypothetical protein I7I53_09427 [Histoplasma capsulatum var. duboisii H88]
MLRRNSQGRSWQEEATQELPEGKKSSERVTHTLASGVNGGTVLGGDCFGALLCLVESVRLDANVDGVGGLCGIGSRVTKATDSNRHGRRIGRVQLAIII